VLLDCQSLEIFSQRLDIGRDVQRLDIGELAELVMLAPAKEPVDGMEVSRPRVLVAEGSGDEFRSAGVFAGVGRRSPARPWRLT
jgi:hypothetical protein